MLRRSIVGRCKGPGGLYNMGNVLGFASGVVFAAASADTASGDAIIDAIAGNPGSVMLTIATTIFIVGGELYHRAYAIGVHAPDGARLLRRADLLNGVGALILAGAVAAFGDYTMAVIFAVLMGGGKLGNALSPLGASPWRIEFLGLTGTPRAFDFDAFRIAALLSKPPALFGLAASMTAALNAGRMSEPETLQTGVLILCYLLWVWADLLLLKVGPAQKTESHAGFRALRKTSPA